MIAQQPAPPVRLAELVASLSLATDLGLGQPQEHILRQTIIATRLATLAGLPDAQQAAVFHVSLLAWVGCVADSHELATWFGDDRQLRADSYAVDKVGLPMLGFMLGHVAAGSRPVRRLTIVGQFLAGGIRDAMDSFVAHCQTTGDIADRLGFPEEVRRSLRQAFERWDGRGLPDRLKGDQIEAAMRVVQIADGAEVFSRLSGTPGALAMLRQRSGTEFDPTFVDLCCTHAEAVFADLDSIDAWPQVIAGCSTLDRPLDESELTAALEVMADYADLKSPWYLGHSRGLALLAGEAARRGGLPEATVDLVTRAALVHRLGAIGVSTGIWDKIGPLTPSESERVRTVPYLTERVLSRQPRLTEIGLIAGMCHERMDGSGYPRGLSGSSIPVAARLLAAADVYQGLGEARPGREALPRAERQRVLEDQVSAGLLDPAAAQLVLVADGSRPRRRTPLVAGLTPREVEVLGLLVRGWSNKQIAGQLSISKRTVGSHIEHVYSKIGVSTRGAASMFAMRHGLISAGEDAPPERSGE